ncbi:MAG: tetratricopeptide repeat protein [Cytophagaceae bacterium]|nr:tetratricopeptide repeat protein [Cytophagaceae bacterium]MDW8457089.1 tetratricopeptide repeat protein [Cytophagaceae bacterium]
MKNQLLFFLFICLFIKGYSQKILPDKILVEHINSGLNKMYNFEFDAAEQYFNKIEKKYPNHPAYFILMSMNLYWEMFYHDNYKEKSSQFIELLNKASAANALLKQKDKTNLETVFFEMIIEAYIALYYAERDETANCVKHVKRAYQMLKIAMKHKDEITDFYFPIGLYNYYVVQYPETKPFYKPFMIFFIPGNKLQGLKDLDYDHLHGVFTRTEAAYYLSNIYLKYENDHLAAQPYVEKLNKNFPKNSFFTVRLIEVMLNKAQYVQCYKYIQELKNTEKPFFTAVAHAFEGIIYEKHHKNYKAAIEYYNQSIADHTKTRNPEKDYLSFAYAGLGRCYHALGDFSKAEQCYKICRSFAEYTSVIQECDRYLKKNR